VCLFEALIVHAQQKEPDFLVSLPACLPTMIFGVLFLFTLVWVAGFFILALPCVLLHLFAARFQIRSPLFYGWRVGSMAL
jgi:hypothetical protein